MPVSMRSLVNDLADETIAVRSMVENLDESYWRRATPAQGWIIADQISHLAYFDEATVRAVTDPDSFVEDKRLFDLRGGIDPDAIAERYRDLPGASLLEWFGAARSQLLATFEEREPSERMPWYGPSMSVASSATARLMETWAHGVDIADALGVPLSVSGRLCHVSHIGYQTMHFSLALHGKPSPRSPIRLELTGPDGESWRWGPIEAQQYVAGPALDFCLAVTQRRHLDDLSLDIVGSDAQSWMQVAQAFAGVAGAGRPARAQSPHRIHSLPRAVQQR